MHPPGPDPLSDPPSEQDIRAQVDRLLLEQGRLDPLEFLLATDLLAYEDYEAWRMGLRADIQGALHGSPACIAEWMDRAAEYARGQRLSATPVRHRGWSGHDAPLHIGAHAGLRRTCSVLYAPPADRPQLDLFHDSSGVLLEEAIRQALAERRDDQAREQLARLMREQPRHPHLRGFLQLIQAIDAPDPSVSPPRRESRLEELERIEPLAHQLLGRRARDFLAPLWTALAQALSGRSFDCRSPGLHASHAWARAGRWEAAREAVEAEPNWRETPALVLTHARACWHRHDPSAARLDWIQLCWDHPLEAERALGAKGFPDRRLADLWQVFGDLDPALETEDFPAWLLLSDAGAPPVPAELVPADDRGTAYRLLRHLVDHVEDIASRRALDEAHPALLRLFLSSRH